MGGAFWVAVDEATGAAGAAGVWAAAEAGVEGAALLDDAADGFGCRGRQQDFGSVDKCLPTLATMHTIKPFSSMLYDSIVLASCRILPIAPGQRGSSRMAWTEERAYQSR